MTILGNKNIFIEEDYQDDLYTLPAVTRKERDEGVSFKKSLIIALILHPTAFGVLLLVTIMLALFGIHLTIFQKPEFKKDIEFVLVQNEGTPRNPHTRNRADINSRSGGINDPKRPVSLPSQAGSAPKPSVQPAASQPKPKAKPAPQPQPQKTAKPVQKQQPVEQPKPVQKPKPVQTPAAKPSPARPAPPTPAPSPRPIAAPKPVAKPSSAFTVPVPPSAPVGKRLVTGPVSGSGSSSTAKTSGGPVSVAGVGSSFAPAPSLSPSASRGGSGQLGRSAGGRSYNAGNPGGGGGAPGIDALREPDFGPYMRELQRKIKLNWDPPKGNESKRVVLLFKIAKDGRLLSCRVLKSSGLQSADAAALKAVELTAPFKPLPADYRGQNIDIQFTFDYNVFGASRY